MVTYAFLTSDNFRIEADGKNPKEAYKKALLKHKTMMKKLQNKPEFDKNAKVLKMYVTYRNGFADYNWRSLK